MKRDFLKGLGIEDKEIVDKILDENSADIGRAKGELDTWKSKVTNLENDIKTKDDTIADLQSKANTIEGLNQKISQLETDKANLTTELDTKVSQLQKGYAIEGAIRDAKGKNVKAIRAFLDENKITWENGELGGISEQLEALAGAEDSSMLFGETQTTPSGTSPASPNGDGKGKTTTANFADAIAQALVNTK